MDNEIKISLEYTNFDKAVEKAAEIANGMQYWSDRPRFVKSLDFVTMKTELSSYGNVYIYIFKAIEG